MDFSVFHRHRSLKWVVGGIGVVLLIMLARGGGSTVATTSSGSGGTSDQVQVATIQAQAQTAASGYALQAAHDNNQTQVQIAQLAAGLQETKSNNELTAALAQIEASLSLGQNTLDTQYHVAQLGAQTQQAAIAANTYLQHKTIDLQAAKDAQDFTLAMLNVDATQALTAHQADLSFINSQQQLGVIS